MCVAFSTDIISLRETVARRAFISVEQCITCIAVAHRAFTKNDNLKCTRKKAITKRSKNSCPQITRIDAYSANLAEQSVVRLLFEEAVTFPG
jgi:hypothetical protein